MKQIWSLFAICLILGSCSDEFEVEDELFAYITSEFSKQSLDLDNVLDSLESLYIEQELIQSDSPADYRQYFQTILDEGRLFLPHGENPWYRSDSISITYRDLERCALREFDGTAFDASKFGQLSQRIMKETRETDQISSGTVAKAYLDILSDEDFEHPFYRASVLLSLQRVYFEMVRSGDRGYLREIPKKVW